MLFDSSALHPRRVFSRLMLGQLSPSRLRKYWIHQSEDILTATQLSCPVHSISSNRCVSWSSPRRSTQPARSFSMHLVLAGASPRHCRRPAHAISTTARQHDSTAARHKVARQRHTVMVLELWLALLACIQPIHVLRSPLVARPRTLCRLSAVDSYLVSNALADR
ncbi:hypothetical protein GQ44DRAFT_486188 [Phaeosphaeriaceae sp. PMI808]|nr:hypothetical protein GQ44DRAFT_486188 [Phaeosphaeriaceae sp. PMI808]